MEGLTLTGNASETVEGIRSLQYIKINQDWRSELFKSRDWINCWVLEGAKHKHKQSGLSVLQCFSITMIENIGFLLRDTT